jgi:hypothetical protein
VRLTLRDVVYVALLVAGAALALWILIDVVATYHCPWDRSRCHGW